MTPRTFLRGPARLPLEPIAPVHVAVMRGIPVRFFASPLEGADFPWAAVEDVLRLSGLKKAERALIAAMWWMDIAYPTRAIVTAEGPAVILPHRVAAELVRVAIERGDADESLRAEFKWAAVSAASRATRQLPYRPRMDWMETAWIRQSTAGNA